MYLVLGIIIGIFLSFIAIVVGIAMYLQEVITTKEVRAWTKESLPEKAIKRGKVLTNKDVERVEEKKRLREESKSTIERLFPNK